jgi:hypothetical protein
MGLQSFGPEMLASWQLPTVAPPDMHWQVALVASGVHWIVTALPLQVASLMHPPPVRPSPERLLHVAPEDDVPVVVVDPPAAPVPEVEEATDVEDVEDVPLAPAPSTTTFPPHATRSGATRRSDEQTDARMRAS